MTTIHRKTALSQTADIILSAHDRGEGLFWERYEEQLPLCAFTANGLNCRKCLNGPCRINPFGDEPAKGVCGADRDQIVMENLFRFTLEGVLETARSLSMMEDGKPGEELPDPSADLPPDIRERLLRAALLPVRRDQIFQIQNSYFSHKAYLSDTLAGLTRLGLIHYGLLKQAALSGNKFAGPASFHPQGANILVVGQGSPRLLQMLKQRAEGKNINILSSPLADQGSPELALAMNADAVIVLPGSLCPALEVTAGKWNVPLFVIEAGKPLEEISGRIMESALRRSREGSYLSGSRLAPAPPQDHERLAEQRDEVKRGLKNGKLSGVAVILGEPGVKQTFFERTLVLMKRCLEEKCLVIIGGELAAHGEFLNRELSRMFAGEPAGSDPGSRIFYLAPGREVPAIVAFLRDVAPAGFGSIPAAISFPEFYRPSTWAKAVTFLSLGLAVQIGTPLPFWGSPALTEVIPRDWPKISGGVLMAGPALPDAETQAGELVSFISSRKEAYLRS